MAANPFDQFDAPQAFAPVSSIPGGAKGYAPVSSIPGGANPFDQFDAPQHTGAGQNWLQKALGTAAGPVEAGLSMATGAVAAPLGSLYGVGYGLTHGYGTQKGANVAEQKGAEMAQRLTYHPMSPQGQRMVGAVGSAFDKSGIMGLGPDMSLLTQGLEGARMAAPAVGRAADVGATSIGRVADRAAPVVRPAARAAAAPIQALGRGANYLLNPEASAGAKAARGMAAALPKELPAPMAEPRAPGTMPSLEPPLAGSKMATNAALRKAFEDKASALDAQRQAAGAAINDAVSNAPQQALTEGDPLYKQLGGLKDTLIKQQERAGTTTSRNALQTIINDVAHIQSSSDTPLSSLIELRRQLSQKAKFGEPVQGFEAIGTQNAAKLSGDLNNILDQHIPGYADARKQYGDVLRQTEPLDASFFKDVGKDETGANDMTSRILASPENLAKAREAMGPGEPADAITTAQKSNSYNGEYRRGNEGVPQPKGTAPEKLFANYGDASRASPQARQAFYNAMAARAKQSPAQFANDLVQSSTHTMPDGYTYQVDAAQSGNTRITVSENGKPVAYARLVKGKIDAISRVSGAAKGVGANLLRFIDENKLGNIHQVPDRTPGFVSAQKAALSDPQSGKFAIAPTKSALDALLAKRVQADLAGKSARDIAQYIKEREPVLKDLPQASKTALDAQSAQEARDALKAVRAQADKQYQQNMQDFAHSSKLQSKYAGQFTRLNELPARKMPAGLRSTLTDMYNDGIIKLDRYQDALRQVKTMEVSINRQSHVLKYTGAATATAFATYALHRKMWNIIVGATR